MAFEATKVGALQTKPKGKKIDHFYNFTFNINFISYVEQKVYIA